MWNLYKFYKWQKNCGCIITVKITVVKLHPLYWSGHYVDNHKIYASASNPCRGQSIERDYATHDICSTICCDVSRDIKMRFISPHWNWHRHVSCNSSFSDGMNGGRRGLVHEIITRDLAQHCGIEFFFQKKLWMLFAKLCAFLAKPRTPMNSYIK